MTACGRSHLKPQFIPIRIDDAEIFHGPEFCSKRRDYICIARIAASGCEELNPSDSACCATRLTMTSWRDHPILNWDWHHYFPIFCLRIRYTPGAPSSMVKRQGSITWGSVPAIRTTR